MDQSDNPGAFYFTLSLNGENTPFQEVSGLSLEEPGEKILDNQFVHHPPADLKHINLVLKKGLMTNGSKFAIWVRDILECDLSKHIQTNDFKVSLMNPDGQVLAGWLIHDAYPVKWGIANANDAESVIIESLEFAYKYYTKSDQ